MDFYEMTCKDIGNFCLFRHKKEKEQYKMMSVIGYRLVDKLMAGINFKNPKNIKYEELFPEFKDEPLTEEQTNRLIAEKWREFLRG